MRESFAGYDDDESDSVLIPLEATPSDFDKLREDILDRISRGISPSTVVSKVNPRIIFVLPNNPFIIRVVSSKYKNLHPPTETEIIENITTQVIKVPKELQNSFVERLDDSIEKIRTFLIVEIAPVVIGFDTAAAESVQMLRLITEDEKLTLNTKKVQELFRELLTLKLACYLGTLLGMEDSAYNKVLDAYLAKYQNAAAQAPRGGNTATDLLNKMLSASAARQQQPPPPIRGAPPHDHQT